MVLRPTPQKIGHFGDVPQACRLLAWYWKTKPNTTKAHIYQSEEMYHNTKINTNKNSAVAALGDCLATIDMTRKVSVKAIFSEGFTETLCTGVYFQ